MADTLRFKSATRTIQFVIPNTEARLMAAQAGSIVSCTSVKNEIAKLRIAWDGL